jgi:hypothetical protein
MKQLDKANLDEWIFDSLEGNLTEGEQEELNDYLSQNPDARIEFEAWSNTYIKEPETPFPDEDKLLRRGRRIRSVWMRWGLNVLAFILICYLGLKTVGFFDSSDRTVKDKVELPAEQEAAENDNPGIEEEVNQVPAEEASMAEDIEIADDEPTPLAESDITEPQLGNEDDHESINVTNVDVPTGTTEEQDKSNKGVVIQPPTNEDTARTPDVNIAAATTMGDAVVDSGKAVDPTVDLAEELSGASSDTFVLNAQNPPEPNELVTNEANTSDSVSTEILSDNDNKDTGAAAIDTSLADGLDSAMVEEVNKPDTTQQNKTKERVNYSKYPIFSVGPFIGYNSSKYKVVTNNPLGDYAIRVSDLDGVSPFEYSAGINFNFRHSKNFAVEAGVWYSQERTLFLALDTTPGVAFNYSGKYLDIPVRLKYHLQLEKLTFYASAGVLFNFNFPAKTRSTYQHLDYKTTYTVTLMPASAGINAIAALGVQFDLKPKLSMYIEPAYTYSFSPIVKHPTFKDVAVDHYTNTIGIGIGLFYKLNGQ